MNIILLTHSREVSKTTNTGRLVKQILPHSQVIIWQRTLPDKNLLQLIASGKTALVYPSDDAMASAALSDFENFILIDSTWQEARKIFNRSPYLQALPRVKIVSSSPSKFNLRRNQVAGGLCTAECAIELLKAGENVELANKLDHLFSEALALSSASPKIVGNRI